MLHPDRRSGLYLYIFIGLAFLPLIIAGLFILYVLIQIPFRYDPSYFTPKFQEMYSTPGDITGALEEALRTGDQSLYSELTGLRRIAQVPEANPNIAFVIVLDVDEHGYYHYLYFDAKTYERVMQYIKEVNNRWVVVPQDAVFAFNSGRWLLTFYPLAALWWALILGVILAILIFRKAARLREELARGLKQ